MRRCRPASWPPVCLALFAWLLTAVVPQASAQLPVARLWTLYPPGAQVGGTVEIAITGADLEDATQLYFSHGGLKAKPKPAAGADKPEANKFLLSVEADAPPGVYEARVVGRFGVSNPRAFTVGDRPEVLAPLTNTTAATARELVPGTVVNGRVVANAAQYFQFRATKAQRVFFECASQSIDSRLDAALVLTDAGGRELERNRRGGGLDFTAPADGVFTLQVHDFLFRGGDEFFYRLSASEGPHLDFIFPPAGQVGSKTGYTLYGRNLPGGRPAPGQFVEGKPLEQLAVEIELPALEAATRSLTTSTLVRPREAFLDGIDHRLASPQGVSNPVRLGFATAPLVVEEDLGAPATPPVKLSLPAEYAGQFRARGQPTELRFEAKKGDAWWVEVFAQRLGWTASPFGVIQRVTRNDKGEEQFADVQEIGAADTNLGGVEFNTATRDPAARFEAKEDGLYRMLVRDLFNPAPGSPRCTYRVLIRRETPDFRLVALAPAPAPLNKDLREASAWTPFLRQGESLPLRVLVARQDGFKGEIELSVTGLPPGVTSSGAKLEGDKNSARLLLTAETNAAGWIGPIKIVGRARVGAEEWMREARGGAVTWNVADYNNEAAAARLTRDFVLAVTGRELAPLTVAAAEGKVWETSMAGKLSIPLEVIRRGDFNGNVKLKGAAPLALEGLKEFEIDGKTNRATLELDLTQQKFAAGEFTIHLQAQSPGKYRRQTPEEVQSAEAQVKETEKSVAELAEALKHANEALGAAKKSADDAAAAVKAAEEKLAGASSATDKPAVEAELAAAKEKAKTAADARAAAEKTAGEAAGKSKEAEQKKEQAANRLKEMAPREVTVTTYSLPIRLKVAPAPITLTVPANAEPIAAGGKLELPVAFTRQFGFAEAVEVTLIWTKPVPGLGATKLTVAKDQSEGKLVVEAAASVAAGDYAATVQAVLKLNGQELKVEQPVTFKVGAAKPS